MDESKGERGLKLTSYCIIIGLLNGLGYKNIFFIDDRVYTIKEISEGPPTAAFLSPYSVKELRVPGRYHHSE